MVSALIMMGGLGLIIGVVLAAASKIFYRGGVGGPVGRSTIPALSPRRFPDHRRDAASPRRRGRRRGSTWRRSRRWRREWRCSIIHT